MLDCHYQTDGPFQSLVAGRLQDSDEVQRAFISVAHAIWNGAYLPELPQHIDVMGLRRYGYLLETIKLFTRSAAICHQLDERIRTAQALLPLRDDEGQGFLPEDVDPRMVEPVDELAEFWGLQHGIKVHRVPGFLAAFFSRLEGSVEPVLASHRHH